jgi:hypothetical protein
MMTLSLAVTLTLGVAALDPAETEALLRESRARIDALGTYRMKFTKEERLASGWVGPQTMDLIVREHPFAVRAVVVQGPNEGRKFLFDSTQRKRELRVREAGLLGITALWIDIDSDLTRDDTRHPVTELGFGFVHRMIERDARLSRPAGGHSVVDAGVDKRGARCFVLTPPSSGVAPGVTFYAQQTRMCIDEKTRLITSLEVSDARGVRERFRFEMIATNITDVTFDIDAI